MTGNYVQDSNWRLPPVYFLKLNNMKLRVLKKKHPSKLERMWIEHYLMWKSLKWLNKDYQSIRLYYMESCKKHIGL